MTEPSKWPRAGPGNESGIRWEPAAELDSTQPERRGGDEVEETPSRVTWPRGPRLEGLPVKDEAEESAVSLVVVEAVVPAGTTSVPSFFFFLLGLLYI